MEYNIIACVKIIAPVCGMVLGIFRAVCTSLLLTSTCTIHCVIFGGMMEKYTYNITTKCYSKNMKLKFILVL